MRCSESELTAANQVADSLRAELEKASNLYLTEKDKAETANKQIEVCRNTIESANAKIHELLQDQKKLKDLDTVREEKRSLANQLEEVKNMLAEERKKNSRDNQMAELRTTKKLLQEAQMRAQIAEARARLPSVDSEDSNPGELTSFQEMERFMNPRMQEVWTLFRQWWTANRGPEEFVPLLNIIKRDGIRRGKVANMDRAIEIVKIAVSEAVESVETLDIYKGMPVVLESRFWHTTIKLVEEGSILYRVPPLSGEVDTATNNERHYEAAKYFMVKLNELKDDMSVYFRGSGNFTSGPTHRVQKDSTKNEFKTRLINWYNEVQHGDSRNLGRNNTHFKELCEAVIAYTTMVGEKLLQALDFDTGNKDLVTKWCKLYDPQWVVCLTLVTLWAGKQQFAKLFQDLVKSWGRCSTSAAMHNTMTAQFSIIRKVTIDTPLVSSGTWEVGLTKNRSYIERELALNQHNRLAECLVYLLNNSHKLAGTALVE